MRTILAGNWKMHKDRAEAAALIDEVLGAGVQRDGTVEVILAPAFPFLAHAVSRCSGTRVHIAAQNCHEESHGAFTGEVSVPMLKSIGVQYTIVGHSERRQYFGDTDAAVAKKIAALLAAGITPIYCCGEKKDQRMAGQQFDTVTEQMKTALGALTNDDLKRVVIAYEPVWAIGTGLNATAQQAQDMHAHIRALLHTHGGGVSEAVPILYGGSCKPDNAADSSPAPT